MIRIKMYEGMGRGVQATERITKGSIVATCEILLLSPSDTIKVNETELKYYTFRVNDVQDCLVLGHGEIFNHSDTPNVKYKLTEINGRLMMVFEALTDIETFSQLFIDYAADAKINAKEYINNKSLVG